jgi:peptide/nickel transport system substrate-binding protein
MNRKDVKPFARRRPMKKMKKFLRLATVLVILGIFHLGLAEVRAASPSGELKGTIHWAISADWLDPATCSWAVSGFFPLYLYHDALLKPMPDGNYTPCLAESWTISPDSKVYEFKLRKGVKFHNGDTMTSEDVVFSYKRYKAAQAKLFQEKTEKIEAIDPYTVRITFKEPFPDFLDYLLPGATSIGWVVPKKYVEKVGDAGFKKHPIGCGPYKYVEFVPGVKLVGEAFDQFWRKVPNVKRMEFLIVTDPATRMAMLRRGEVDMATLLTDIFYQDAKKDPKLKLLSPLSPTRWLIYMTAQWDPKSPWSDPRVRKAASLAIDRKLLADVHMPGCSPIGNLALQGDPMAADIPVDPYDPEKAKKLLAEAGYPKGFHGGTFYPYDGPYWQYGEQVANYLKAVGINVDIVLLERPAWMANRSGGKMKGGLFIDLVVAPTIGGSLSTLYGSTAYGHYPEVKALWEQYTKAVDLKSRKDLITRVQKLIHEKMEFVPLTNTNSPAAFSQKVKGNPYKVQPIIWFIAPFEDVELTR